MKTLFLKLSSLILFCTVFATNAQHHRRYQKHKEVDKTQFIGTWAGNFTHEGDLKKITINLNLKDDVISASLNVPTLSRKKITAETKVCHSQRLHIRFKDDDKLYELIGKLNGESISGSLTHVTSTLFNSSYKKNGTYEIFTLKKSK